MHAIYRKLLEVTSTLAVVLSLSAPLAHAQQYPVNLPASSAGGTRQAVASINLGSIQNDINYISNVANNAQNTANWAAQNANNAWNQAMYATNVVQGGGARGSWATDPGSARPVIRGCTTNNVLCDGNVQLYGGCVWGMGGAPLPQPLTGFTVDCPGGSGWVTVSLWVRPNANDPGGPGGGGY